MTDLTDLTDRLTDLALAAARWLPWAAAALCGGGFVALLRAALAWAEATVS